MPTGAYLRPHVATLLSRLAEPPARLIIVAGPRQVGKTTLVRHALERCATRHLSLAVDDPADVEHLAAVAASATAVLPGRPKDAEWLVNQWTTARTLMRESDNGFVLVLDEIQKIPRWSEVIKGLWDADRAAGLNMHVVLLGSSPLLMQRGMTESLAGRYELIRVTHWSFLEMYEAFDFSLDDYIVFGGYPGSAPYIRDEPRWRGYVLDSLIKPSIELDILMMTRIDKPALLKQVFELGCTYSGQILSYTKMLGHLQDAGNTVTLSHYLELLAQAGLLVGLQKYAGREHRRRASPPKLNVLNPCLMAVQSNCSKAEILANREFWGHLTESVVGAHLYNTGHSDVGVFYWRESPHEVDFVIEKGPKLTAIEVKSGAASRHVSGLDEFQMRYPHATKLLVGTGGIPLVEFLSYPAEHWLG